MGIFLSVVFFIAFYQFQSIEKMAMSLKEKFFAEKLTEESLPEPFSYYFAEMEKSISEKKINQAMVLFNQALFFSPDLVVKGKFEILKSFITNPELRLIPDDIPFKEIKKNPYLYEGTFFKIVAKFQYKKKK